MTDDETTAALLDADARDFPLSHARGHPPTEEQARSAALKLGVSDYSLHVLRWHIHYITGMYVERVIAQVDVRAIEARVRSMLEGVAKGDERVIEGLAQNEGIEAVVVNSYLAAYTTTADRNPGNAIFGWFRTARAALASFSIPRGKPPDPSKVARDELIAGIVELAMTMKADLTLPQKRDEKSRPLLDFAEFIRSLAIATGRDVLRHRNDLPRDRRECAEQSFADFGALHRATLVQYLSTAIRD